MGGSGSGMTLTKARLESNFEEGDILGDEKDARKC